MESVDVYVRNEDNLEDDETWDDKLLIEAYNKSVNSIKKKIAQRMGIVNGFDEGNNEEEVSPRPKSSKKGQNRNKWSVGDFCRANYSVDGLDYEAKIKQILPEGQCIVEYLGYANEEVVRLKDLKKSLGKQFRVMQKLAATQNDNEKSDASESYENFGGVRNAGSRPEWPCIPGVPAIPPPPPLNLLSQSGIPESESEALSTMLMSWYMTGYHTGYYQGLTQSKQHLQKLPKK